MSVTNTLSFDNNVYSGVLDNDLIVQIYKVEENFGSKPLRLDFYDEHLDLQFFTTIPSTDPLRISPIKLVEGRGDYFFLMGSFTDFNTNIQYGYLSKISNEGEVIWSHLYQHPDYMEENIIYAIGDLIEEENGDLICMGNVFPIVTQQELWLFKVNEHGCFGTDTCEEEVIYTSVANIDQVDGIKVYPNPAQSTLFIESPDHPLSAIAIFDMQGKLVHQQAVQNSAIALDVDFLEVGIYGLRLMDTQGKLYRKLFLKE